MSTWRDIFKAFGGPAELGRALGISTEHATQMRRRDSIPPLHWPRLIEAAREKKIEGVNYEALAKLAATASRTSSLPAFVRDTTRPARARP